MFTADSAYSYICIGDFSRDTSMLHLPGGFSNYFVHSTSAYFIDDVSVTECDSIVTTEILQIPNVITPNNDGKNDAFLIENLPEQSTLTIFNRWGNIVYSSLNYQNNWKADGVIAGTYYYLLKLPSGEVKKGFLEVIK